jgi:hypothetical protein
VRGAGKQRDAVRCATYHSDGETMAYLVAKTASLSLSLCLVQSNANNWSIIGVVYA